MQGAEKQHVDATGNLELNVGETAVTFLKPVAYQLAADGKSRVPVAARYTLGEARRVGFALGEYDRTRPLVIDPVLIYGLDIPGAPGFSSPPYYSLDTMIAAMTVDPAGNTYVASSVGSSYSSTSVMKFDPTGKLLFNVSLGSENSGIDPRAIAVDAAGDIYLAGNVSAGLLTTPNALQPGAGPPKALLAFLR